MASSMAWKSTILIVGLLLSFQFNKITGHGGADDETTNTDTVDLHSKGLILVKIWCLIILFVSTFAGGVSPYFYRWNEDFLLLGTQFAGGVFLGTSLMHFLSDSTSTFGDLTTKEYPFSFMLACSGYLLTMLGDIIIISVTKGVGKEVRVEVGKGRGDEGDGHKEAAMDLNPVFVKTTHLGDTILLILALCFHSVFEGIAVGVAGHARRSCIVRDLQILKETRRYHNCSWKKFCVLMYIASVVEFLWQKQFGMCLCIGCTLID